MSRLVRRLKRCAAVGAALGLLGYTALYLVPLPAAPAGQPLPESTKILDREGRLLYDSAGPADAHHTYVSIDQVPARLKQAVIAFGEPMPEADVLEAERRARRCDLFVVVGSSLVVFPAASMPLHAVRGGAKLVIINDEATPQDEIADVVLRGKAGEVLPEIVRQVKERLGGG